MDELNSNSFADLSATFVLALSYLNSIGVERSVATAHRLLRQAASKGHAVSARVRAHLVGAGVGVPADIGKAKQMCRRSPSPVLNQAVTDE